MSGLSTTIAFVYFSASPVPPKNYSIYHNMYCVSINLKNAIMIFA